MSTHTAVNINFASRSYRLFFWVSLGLHTLSALCVLAIVLLIAMAFFYRSGVAETKQKLKDLETSVEKMRPVMREREQLVNDLSDMTTLMNARTFSWTGLLTNIEAVFPTGVALKTVDYDTKTRSLTLDGRARSPESLRNLIIGMEKSVSFREPRLKQQSVDRGHISFKVVAQYEDYGTNVVQGK